MKPCLHWILAAACSFLAGSSLTAAVANEANVVLEKVKATYAALSSYEDSGVVLSHMPDKDQPDQIIFKTVFLRPDLLRFDFTTHHPYPPLRHIKTQWSLWPDAGGKYTLTGAGPRRDGHTLNEVVAAATGVSRRASFHIARLLTPAISGAPLTDLAGATLAAEEVFENLPCIYIQGKTARGGSCELWIGKDDYLIRRIKRTEANLPITEEIHRDIRTNSTTKRPGTE